MLEKLIWLIGFFILIAALASIDAFAVPNRSARPSESQDYADDEVRIAVACGTLRGSGRVLIVDPVASKTYVFPFTCPLE